MKHIAACPVKDRHKVVADHLYAEGREISDCLDVVVDVPVTCRQPDLDVVMNVDGFHDIGVEACRFDLIDNCFDFFRLPDLSGQLVVQRPDDRAYARDLPDIGKGNV